MPRGAFDCGIMVERGSAVSESWVALLACGCDMDIADWRKKIDEIDRRLVQLLNERARCAVEIGKIKRQKTLPIREPQREREVLQHVIDANQGPLQNDALQRVFERIVGEGRVLQSILFNAQDSEGDSNS